MMSLAALKKKAFTNQEVKEAYDELGDEFELISTLITMREKSGLTQDEVAQKMGTRAPNISRLESGRGNPSLKTLVSYAQACGFKLDLGFKHV
ncbi:MULTISPECIES: helix-turn-helix domain-containing protein [Vibrio]|jgi:DNA-binding XRE family transcriptional regulator|uniref:XRE family transcriptional regulator n=1 Tax=Vibrio vulnificus TaxID=672 RepID=A0A2S3R8B1_VIBVL|nr:MULTISPECIES: helix-turn-helix transcriptional regulator [Vibrio]AWG82215.1 XRE family transcriptional regulator [Vibrio parahaemolyticus]AWJ81835.1 XRE family transcriptional regulator [Vibrio parahaemolyticus]EJX5615291.1 helix-turn-helix transcriptional regulator [Vibrio parahaemolyticus]MBE4440661.1 helix-turn-helix transcriptional regulator [Vibrio parahaemolyticus]MDI7869814.1 helix-turn-helix transcriptional regulator [Vibrio parahaemolyticus]